MKASNIVRVRVQQADFECDEYGFPECEPKSIKVALILVVKQALDLSLKQAKDVIESQITDPTGRVVFSLVLDDAGLGRLTRVIYERRAMNSGRSEAAQLTDIDIVEIRTDQVLNVEV